jgi:hypothetical protein
MTDKVKIEIECTACRGTGVYRDWCWLPGIGDLCLDCEGSGKVEYEYTPFTGRKKRADVNKVRLLMNYRVPDPYNAISYEEFLQSNEFLEGRKVVLPFSSCR